MNNKLLISGSINSGWAMINFESNQEIFTLRTSYIFDGLSKILAAVSLLNKGLKEIEASLIEEPNEHIIHFTKNYDNDNLIIKYFTFNNFVGGPLLDRFNDTIKPDFVIQTTLKRFTVQMCNLFDYFRKSYGLEGYEDRWRHSFPLDKLNDLRNGFQ